MSNNQPKIGPVNPPNEELEVPEFPARNGPQRLVAATTKQPRNREKVMLEPGHSALDWAKLKTSGKDLRGVSQLGPYTLEDLRQHRTLDDAWTAIQGKVYNITPYLKFHPGGVKDLMRCAGRDGTKLFMMTHSWQMSKIFLTPEQEKTRKNIYYSSGLKGALVGLGLGAAVTVFTIRRSPEFRLLNRPLQSTMIVSSTVAGFLFSSDSAVTHFENIQLGYADETVVEKLMGKKENNSQASTFDRSLQYLNNNRWSFIGFSWAISMAGALGYSFSNKYLTTQQKIVQSRMYAQAVTIAVLMASAGISAYVGDDKKNQKELPDPQLKAVLELPENMKKSSPNK